MAAEPKYQIVKLMPEAEWNVEKGPGRFARPMYDGSEGLLRDTATGLMRKDHSNAQKSAGGLGSSVRMPGRGQSTPDMAKKGPALEHYAVDNIDISMYQPIRGTREDILLDLCQKGYYEHRPMVFSPDLVYGYLAKGVALHINKYPEQLRKLYVNHDGKKKLVYQNDSFVRGDNNNDWADMFQFFADELKKETKSGAKGTGQGGESDAFQFVDDMLKAAGGAETSTGSSVVQNDLKFSTSTKMTQAHRNVLAMESMKSYFEYVMLCGCGTACVILEGTLDDWKLLQKTITTQLREINDYSRDNEVARAASLEWWTPTVELLLENFVNTYESQEKGQAISEELKLWWGAIYRYNAGGGSGMGGPTYISGWVNIFFPYLRDDKQNPWVTHWAPIVKNKDLLYKTLHSVQFERQESGGFGRSHDTHRDEIMVNPDDYVSYVAAVPFKWVYYGEEFSMKALIGYSVMGKVAVEGKDYPAGTLKVFPAWVIYYEN